MGTSHQLMEADARHADTTTWWSFIQSEILVLASQAVFFTFAWFFFRAKLFKDYEVKKWTVQFLFSLTFTLSCSMFELIIFEIFDITDRKYVIYFRCEAMCCATTPEAATGLQSQVVLSTRLPADLWSQNSCVWCCMFVKRLYI